MDPASELLKKLLELAGDKLTAAIEDIRSEAFYIDFKRSAADAKHPKRLSDPDRNHLAKAISGFANGEGGVIVWGVDCRRNDDGWDEIEAISGVADAHLLRSLLDDHAHKLTIPPQVAVESHVSGPLADGKQLVATHVPRGTSGPVQSLVIETQ